MLTFAIPTWNRANQLDKCLESICKEIGERKNIFVAIANNFSSDNTSEIINKYAKKYNYISFVNMPRKSASWLYSVKLVNTEWTWTFGDDDTLKAGSLDRIIQVLKNHQKISYLHVTQEKRSSSSGKLFLYKNFFDLCSNFGWIDTCGFLSSNISKTNLLIDAYKLVWDQSPGFDLVEEYDTPYPHANGILEVFYNQKAALFDFPAIKLQDHEMTNNTKERWSGEGLPQKEFKVPKAIKKIIERTNLPNQFKTNFFRYHEVYLWSRSFNSINPNQPFNTTEYKLTLELLSEYQGMVSDKETRKVILSSAAMLSKFEQQFNQLRDMYLFHAKLNNSAIFSFQNYTPDLTGNNSKITLY